MVLNVRDPPANVQFVGLNQSGVMIGTLEEATHAAVVFTHACFVVADFIAQLMVIL